MFRIRGTTPSSGSAAVISDAEGGLARGPSTSPVVRARCSAARIGPYSIRVVATIPTRRIAAIA